MIAERTNSSAGVNVLFTSVGRRVELLRSFREAYQTLGISGRIVAVDIDPLAPALRLADTTYLVPRLDDPGYIPSLLTILERERPAVVFPLIDPDIPVLAAHRRELEATGARLAVVSPKASAIAADKWHTCEFFRGLGLTVAASWLPGELDPAKADYPLFIKPRGGSASQETFKVKNPRQLEFFCEYVTDPIVQEYLPGPEITNDVICDLDGKVLSVVSRQRIRVRGGEVTVGMTVFDPAIAEACVRIAGALPAVGPVTVQCMMKDTRDRGPVPVFTEINARLGGGLPLGISAGANSPLWLLAAVADMPVEIPPLGSYRRGVYLSRFDQSLFLTEAEREQMASHRV
ncbi:MAG: ATP-grasp domain-containing protein [Pirellulales bacterium]|nr:ATP-grasp domain-containing protein [Pirellulales bacterium]